MRRARRNPAALGSLLDRLALGKRGAVGQPTLLVVQPGQRRARERAERLPALLAPETAQAARFAPRHSPARVAMRTAPLVIHAQLDRRQRGRALRRVREHRRHFLALRRRQLIDAREPVPKPLVIHLSDSQSESERFYRNAYDSRIEPFSNLARDLFGAMATGGRVGFEAVARFNGGLFDDDTALPLNKAEIATTLKAAALDWSEIDPSILGTLFERGLDPDKRSQLGAHYTDRDKIMRIVEPVVVRPWLAEWESAKAEISADLERANAAKSKATKTRRMAEAERRLRAFLERLRAFTVLDPACGSGNFLYLALQALKDVEHQVNLEAEAMGLKRALPEIGPANVKGIEINPYAAELARVSVWIGEIQWMRRNGFNVLPNPILQPLDPSWHFFRPVEPDRASFLALNR